MSAKSKRRSDEEWSRRCFDRFLGEHLGLGKGTWCEPQQDPPDYWLTVGERRFAVEVTALVEKEVVSQEEALLSVGYGKRLETLAKQIQCQANAQALNGVYVLGAVETPVLPRLAKRRRKNVSSRLMAKAVEYIRDTQAVPSGNAVVLHEDAGGHLKIWKIGVSSELVVGHAWSPGAKYRAEWEQEAVELVRERLTTKICKLQCLRGEQNILLLLKAYPFPGPNDYLKYPEIKDLMAFFHSVFMVLGQGSSIPGYFLYSKDSTWWPRHDVSD